jgi:hypothetical protein
MLDTWASLTAAERKAVKDLFSELLHDPKVPPSPTYVSLAAPVAFTTSQLTTSPHFLPSSTHTRQPEVQLLALAGMVAYLAGRPASELRTLAEAYIKNSDIFAAREAKKRKASAGATTGAAAATATDKPDKVLVDTFGFLSYPVLISRSSPHRLPPSSFGDRPQVHTTTVLMMACMIQALPYDLPAFVPPLLTSFVRHVTVPSLKDIGTSTFARKHTQPSLLVFISCFLCVAFLVVCVVSMCGSDEDGANVQADASGPVGDRLQAPLQPRAAGGPSRGRGGALLLLNVKRGDGSESTLRRLLVCMCVVQRSQEVVRSRWFFV